MMRLLPLACAKLLCTLSVPRQEVRWIFNMKCKYAALASRTQLANSAGLAGVFVLTLCRPEREREGLGLLIPLFVQRRISALGWHIIDYTPKMMGASTNIYNTLSNIQLVVCDRVMLGHSLCIVGFVTIMYCWLQPGGEYFADAKQSFLNFGNNNWSPE